MWYAITMQDIYQTFEINKIKEKLLEYSRTELGKEYIDDLKMFSHSEDVQTALEDLKEVMSIILRYGVMPISTSANALYLIEMAKKTALLTPRDLNLIAEDVITSQKIAKFIEKIDFLYPRVKAKVAKFVDLSSLEKEIHRVITNSLTIADKATPELADLRRKIKKAETNLHQKVASLSLTYSSYLNDTNATIRDGHFVLPVKSIEKNKVLGIVYDISDSGATTFIEPMEIVQINNEITSLKVEENEECRKILKALTALVLLQEGEIINNNLIIGDFDFLSAKALYAKEIDAEVATYCPTRHLELVHARHPLIPKEKVIANSFHLDEQKRIVIISGPNAGGKTVSLKTVGILVLMNQCGLAVPATRAELGYFPNIYIDIGDNQSLSDNLSTFSAHMSHISEIVQLANKDDLVLLDELGTGTAPREGEALALAITKFLESKGVFAMLSSHFDALKEYAFISENIENSSMIFDEEKLIPTYRFKLGSTGHSYALDVASRYGISDNIIKEARTFLTNNSQNDTTTLLGVLETKIKENTILADQLEKTKKDLLAQEQRLAKEEEKLKTRRETLLEDVQDEKDQIIAHAEGEIDAILSMLNKDGVKMHEVIELKRQLDDLKTNPETIVYNEAIEVGDYVSLPSYGVNGKVMRLKGEKAHIIGDNGLAFDVEINKLHKIEQPKIVERPHKGHGFDQILKLDVGLELNIIGCRSDEAKEKLIKYLDNCRIKHLSQVRIIHGFGSGVLRKMTHEYLDSQKDVTYRPGHMNEGGGGATVVTFNS